MINVTSPDTRPNLSITHHDLAGAQSWMADICGPYNLSEKHSERVSFDHMYHRLRFLGAMIIGELCYGTEVDVTTNKEAPNCYSLSLPINGDQDLTLHEERFHSNHQWAIVLIPFEHQKLSLGKDCRQLHVTIPYSTSTRALENMLFRKISEPVLSSDGRKKWSLGIVVAHGSSHRQ